MVPRLQVIVAVAAFVTLAHAACAAEPLWPDTYFFDVINDCPYPVTVTFSAEAKETVPADTFQRLITPYADGEQTIKFEAEGKPAQEVKSSFATIARGACYYGRRVVLEEKLFDPKTVSFVKPAVANVTFLDGEWSVDKSENNLLIDYPYDAKELTIVSRSGDEVQSTLKGYRFSTALGIDNSQVLRGTGDFLITLQPDLVKPFVFRGPAALSYRTREQDGDPVNVTFKSWVVLTFTPGGQIPQATAMEERRMGDVIMVSEKLEGLPRAPRLPLGELLRPLGIADDAARRTAVDELQKSMSALGFAARVTKSPP